MSTGLTVLIALGTLIAFVLAMGAVWAFGTANRLDRLHVRYDLSWQALDSALARRAVVARAVAADSYGDLAVGRRLVALADAAERAPRAGRETAENELSTALARVDMARLPTPLVAELADAEARVVLARRFHNDAVRDTLALRERPVVRLLRRLGCAVDFPMAQTCCGQMFTNTGYAAEAVPAVRTFVEAFAGYDAIVAPSGSCVGSVRHQHRDVVARAGDPGLRAAVDALAPRVHELSEFLVDVLGVIDVGAYFPHRVTYHPTCHSLRMLRVGDRPLQLLRAVRGLDLIELPGADQCCGFGGTFAMKNADTSVAMGSDKVRHVRNAGAEVLVASDNSCLAHIGGMLSRQRSGMRVLHLAEILASTEEHPA